MSHHRANQSLGRAAVVEAFSDLPLHPATMRALTRMGITQPTPIQAEALPILLDQRDVIGQARTGSGKTLAFLVPAVEFVDPAQHAVQVLVLTPTRELAVQIERVLAQLAEGRGISGALIFGGRAAGPQISALRRGAQVVIGTPGRVLDLLNRGALTLDQLRFLVLDEADQMLDQGFAPDVERILARAPRRRQTALFSATVPNWVRKTADKHLRRPSTVAVDPDPADTPPITHVAYDLPDDEKLVALQELLDLRGRGSIIVFGRTKHGVRKLARRLERDGYPAGALQGNLSQNARDRVMQQFRTGEVQILVATNVAARGLDISSVDQVINLELPESPELLTHRIGRTGRMGREGRAITLLGPKDGAKWREFERALGRRIPRSPWRGGKVALGLESGLETRAEEAPRPLTRLESGHAPRQRKEHPGRPVERIVADRPRVSARGHRVAPQPRQRTSITCSGCGTPAEVPFRPDPTRPVYCSDCHRARQRGHTTSSIRG